jgi:hypothetical protein
VFEPRICISLFNGEHDRDLGEDAIRDLCEALIAIDRRYLARNPVPALYDVGIRYKEQPEGVEDWYDIPTAIYEGRCDCKSLACWRIAELRNAGVNATVDVMPQAIEGGMWLYHIRVVFPDGTIEDPSLILGMGQPESAAA